MAQTSEAAQKKGEIYELRCDLRSDKKERKKDAIKRTISHMTLGKDVSELFTDVVNCMQTDSMELKKLVYLYVMNYAKSHPDVAILAVNSFVKDCDDSNPLIRALAVRTMGCIKVAKISEYLCEPLRKKLNDDDPYVRKTAVVCVVKLYLMNPELVEEQGFIKQLQDLLNDPNPMVVSNSIACLSEIAMRAPPDKNIFPINFQMINKLLTAINECTEWGQCYILDSIVNFEPSNETEAQSICERITSRLSHSNSALVLSSIKVLMRMLAFINPSNPVVSQIYRKMAPPLVTMLTLDPEIQYVALRNMNLITQKNSDILKNEIKAFFVKYNDPIYVKIEKLDIIIKLVDENNIQHILTELKEYSAEVDVDFVRKSVRAIGRCALKVESSADKCVSTLLDLIQTKVSYVVQESIVVMRDIMRKMPNKYESVIEKLCENLDSLNEPEARGALIWVIGEYAHVIDNASDILRSFAANLLEENTTVQLQILSAVVKLFLKKSAENQDLVQDVLTTVTQQSENPDIRDRGYIYWRLLSTDPAAARSVVLGNKPLISPEADYLDTNLLNELLLNMSTLASIYHKLPQTFVDGLQNFRKATVKPVTEREKRVDTNDNLLGDDFLRMSMVQDLKPVTAPTLDNDNFLLDFEPALFGIPSQPSSVSPLPASVLAPAKPPTVNQNIDLLNDIFMDSLVASPQLHPVSKPTMQHLPEINVPPNDRRTITVLMNTIDFNFSQPQHPDDQTVWLPSSKGKGLEVSGGFKSTANSLSAHITLTNNALVPLSDFAIQFNVNYLGITIGGFVNMPPVLTPKSSHSLTIPLHIGNNRSLSEPVDVIQVAMKDNVDVFYFTVSFPFNLYFVEPVSPSLEEEKFFNEWHFMPTLASIDKTLSNLSLTPEKIHRSLLNYRLRASIVNLPSVVFGLADLLSGEKLLVQVTKDPVQSSWKLSARGGSEKILTHFVNILSHQIDST